MVHTRLTQGKNGFDIVPVFWDDNYFSLLPGEVKTVEGRYAGSSAGDKTPVLEIEGYNIVPAILQP